MSGKRCCPLAYRGPTITAKPARVSPPEEGACRSLARQLRTGKRVGFEGAMEGDGRGEQSAHLVAIDRVAPAGVTRVAIARSVFFLCCQTSGFLSICSGRLLHGAHAKAQGRHATHIGPWW